MSSFSWPQHIQNLPDTWGQLQAPRIKVALLDSGVNFHHAGLAHLNKPGHKFDFQKQNPTGDDDVQDMKPNGEAHGTCMASVLAGKPEGVGGVEGFAPDIDLYIFRISDAQGSPQMSIYLRALKKAIQMDMDIVVAAVSPLEDTSIPDSARQEVLDQMAQKNILLFAPTKNTNRLDRLNNLEFPSASDKVLTVGRVSKLLLERMQPNDQFNPAIDYFVPNLNVSVCSEHSDSPAHLTEMGSSFGVAASAGIISLALSDLRKSEGGHFRLSRTEASEVLNQLAEQISLDGFDQRTKVCLFTNTQTV